MEGQQNKKITVVIPNYNYAKYLKKRIKSVLEQTYPIYELIILDDCSTDNSDAVIKKMIEWTKKNHPRINVRYVKNEKNSGKAILQWKKGFELARGDYVWVAEADDLSRKNFLKEVMRGFLDRGVAISYTESAIIDSRGIVIVPNFRWSRDKERTGHFKKDYIKPGVEEITEIMAVRCTIPNVSAVVFRKSPEILKYLDEAAKYKQVGDWYLYLSILERNKISYCRKPCNKFRIHRNSATRKSNRENSHFSEILEIHKNVEKKYNLNEDTIRRMRNEEKRICPGYKVTNK
jgi:glycosyltransferase involved in cell wall biosynthesis